MALLSFCFWNKILVGWEKKVPSFLSYFKSHPKYWSGPGNWTPDCSPPPRPQNNIYSYVQILLQLLGEILLTALQFSLAYIVYSQRSKW